MPEEIECGIMWGECDVTEDEHECDLPRDHRGEIGTGRHHCGWCGEES